jgi:hypothetical protein
MDWKKLINELTSSGLSQAAIGAALGKSQAWVCAVSAGQYRDLKWGDGEKLRRLHADRAPTQPETTQQAEAA